MNTCEELKAFAEAQGLTQGQLAAKLGVSTATVNQYLQGKYKGDTAALDAKAVQLMARSREKAKEVKQAFVETTSAKNMLEIWAYWTKKELFWRTLRLLDKKGAIRHPMMRNSPL